MIIQVVADNICKGLDEDRVLANCHSAIRELVSMPLWEQVRKHHPVIAGLLGKKATFDLRLEICLGQTTLLRIAT
eukprot:6171406-Amphidinium_carterae.2